MRTMYGLSRPFGTSQDMAEEQNEQGVRPQAARKSAAWSPRPWQTRLTERLRRSTIANRQENNCPRG